MPLVAFTATATIDDIAFVEKICRFKTTRIVWATPKEMQKSEVNISMTVRTVFRSVTEKLIINGITGEIMDQATERAIQEKDVSKT